MSDWGEHARAILSGAVAAMEGVDRPAAERALLAAAPSSASTLARPGLDPPPAPSPVELEALEALAGAAWRAMTDDLRRQVLAGVPAASRSPDDAERLARKLLQLLPRGTTLGARLRVVARASALDAELPEITALRSRFQLGPRVRERPYGTVHQAFDTVRRAPVDLWLIRPEVVGRPESLKTLLEWARRAIAANLRDVIAPREVLRGEGGEVALVTDLSGRTLAALATGPLPIARAVAIIRALIVSVRASGTRRALTPDEVGVGGAGGARLILEPPGLRPPEHGRAAAGFDGHLAYLPPEVLEDATACDERSLVYGVGALLSLLLAGEPPFRGRTALELLRAIREGRRRPLDEPRTPAVLRAVIDRALAPAPAERMSLDDLDRALAPFA